jgi:alanine racemase
MNRYGFNHNEIESIISKIKYNTNLNVESICSHLATSDNKKNSDFTIKQIENFKSISQKFEKHFRRKIDKYILNSHAVLNFTSYQMDGVRLGIGLYGSIDDTNLKQISCLTSTIAQTRDLKKGESVGYSNSFIAEENMKIGIIPIGYADGINKQLGNNIGSVFTKSYECAIIGEISMDSFAIDITKSKAKEGDLVEIFGDQLSVSKIAKKINTIPYEIYSTLNRRIKRIYSD